MTSDFEVSPLQDLLFFLKDQPKLDWESQGDEFMHRVGVQLAEVTGQPLVGHSMTTVNVENGGRSYWYRRYSFSGPTLLTALATLPTSKGEWLVAVVGTDADQANAEAGMWAEAIARAEAELGGTLEQRWWSVVAPVSSIAGALVLNERREISGITLERPVVPHARLERTQRPRGLGNGGQIEVIFPVVAHGSAVGYNAPAAMERANGDLLRLCAALTLDTDTLWEVIEAPQQFERDPASLPTSEDAWMQESLAGNLLTREVRPSDLAVKAIAQMRLEGSLSELLSAYYHARAIQEHSPSLAAVIYVSVVEAIGASFVPLAKCDCCGECEQLIGYARQFRQGLKLVLAPKDAKRLGNLYGKRSKTAHQAALHGAEFRLWSIPNSFVHDPADYFLYQEVREVRSAAGRLLRLMVLGELPGAESATSV